MKISVGQVWLYDDDSYLLCNVGSCESFRGDRWDYVVLVFLDDANRFTENPFPVKNKDAISMNEWKQITGGRGFKLLGTFDEVYGRKA